MKWVFRIVVPLAAVVVVALLIPRSGSRQPSPQPGTDAASASSTRISNRSQFAACKEGAKQDAVAYTHAEVEPHGAINPRNRSNWVVTWQQDRWSDGGARALPVARSDDGGATWTTLAPAAAPRLTLCSGGTKANGGDYERASDPWVSFAPNGDLYHIGLAFNRSNGRNAVLVSTSTDGGATWSDPVAVQEDQKAFNDKETITADPLTTPDDRASKAYAVWSRDGDAWFNRTTDGRSWEKGRPILKEGFTVGHQIVVHRSGHLIDIFSMFKRGNRNYIAVMRSTDGGRTRGDSWSDPIVISKFAFGYPSDPDNDARIRAGEAIPDIAADLQTGAVYAVWQDLLFRASGKRYSGIAFSMSRDGGRRWSKPIRINQPGAALDDPNDQGIIPSLDVASDGTVAVSYYDFRQNTGAESVSTDHWLVRCRGRVVSCTDRSNWSESHVAGPFDIEIAPKSMGLFLGDYMGLAAVGRRFALFFVQSSLLASNRTNVFVRRM